VRKFIGLIVVVMLAFVVTSINVEAKSKPVVSSFSWTEQSVDFGGDFNICVNGFHSFEYTIYAGQNKVAGSVVVSINANGDFVLNVDLIDGALASEAHLFVYSELSQLPVKRVAPGQAPYQLGSLGLNTFEYTVSTTELVDGDSFYFVFHMALVDEDVLNPSGVAGETAYVGGPNGPTSGSWFYAFGFEVIACDVVFEMPVIYVAFHAVYGEETVWALGELSFIELGLTNSRWGWQLTFDANPETFDLYAGAAQNDLSKGEFIGTLTLSWDGQYVTFTLQLADGVELSEIQIHVDYLPVDTISPGQLGYQASDAPFTSSWTVSLLPESDR
jgi:hypothetical protein